MTPVEEWAAAAFFTCVSPYLLRFCGHSLVGLTQKRRCFLIGKIIHACIQELAQQCSEKSSSEIFGFILKDSSVQILSEK